MRYLIRFLSRGPAGSVEQHDRTYEGEAVTLGRATDQVLHLKDRSVGLEHARIESKAGVFRIGTSALAGISVNGRSYRESDLSVGDEVSMGSNLIKVFEPPAGFDFAFSFELDPEAKPQDVPTNWTSLNLSSSGWSRRRWSWRVALVVFAGTLLIPGLSLISPEIAGFTRSSVLPSDRLWAAGPIHALHGGETAACEGCHASPFARVKDTECLACHTADRHVSVTAVAQAVLGETRCASCHLEHNQPPSLVNRRQQLCGDCHSGLESTADQLGLENVSDFGTAHPEFRVSLLQPNAAGQGAVEWSTIRLALTAGLDRDRSNLRFPHSAHLDPGGISSPAGDRVLDCSDCHTLEPGGALMEPITMEQHCSTCHSLSFDPADPNRELPHGSPDAVIQELVEYYSARLLGGEAVADGRVILRPGQALTNEDRDRVAAEAEQQALAVAADIFERRTCATCHEVTVSTDAATPYRIEPVRLTQQFFPHADFSHAAHDDDVADCRDCHAAETSDASSDVLMPGIDSCRDCHGSGISRLNLPGQSPATCIVCHAFHIDSKGEYQ